MKFSKFIHKLPLFSSESFCAERRKSTHIQKILENIRNLYYYISESFRNIISNEFLLSHAVSRRVNIRAPKSAPPVSSSASLLVQYALLGAHIFQEVILCWNN